MNEWIEQTLNNENKHPEKINTNGMKSKEINTKGSKTKKIMHNNWRHVHLRYEKQTNAD